MENATSFCEEISLMMFGFGDNQKPNKETVQLVESVILKQLRDILYEITKNVDRKKAVTVNTEDVIFLFRHDKHKMQRFVKYFHYKYARLPSINASVAGDEAEKASNTKKYKSLIDFIESIDETGELLDTDEFDEVKYERLLRAERISSALDEEKYKEYASARQVSFFCKKFSKPNKFRSWIDPNHELNISQAAIEILEIIAYGIVGHITDMALIVRQNSKRKSNDPLHSLTGSFYNSTMFHTAHSTHSQARNCQLPITVSEVREVLRRCYMPQVGYMKFSRYSMPKKRKLFLY